MSHRSSTKRGEQGTDGTGHGARRWAWPRPWGFLLALAVVPALAVACSDEASDDRGPLSGGGPSDDRADGSSAADGGGPDTPDPGADGSVATDGGDGGEGDAGPKGPLYAFVGSSDGKIRTYLVDEASGAWSAMREFEGGTNPTYLAFDPPRRRVVVANEVGAGGGVRSFTFDPANGSLTFVNSRGAGGSGTAHVSLDPQGKWAFVANYTAGNASVFPIGAGASLGASADTVTSGANSHWAGTNPSGTHAFVVALGANVVAQYTLNAATGELTGNGTVSLPANAGARHLAFHPTEKWAYVINETAITVSTMSFDKATGKLALAQTVSALPPGQSAAGVSGAAIAVHPSGKWVYASTRVYNSIAHFSVDAANGTLTRVANSLTGGNRPRTFALDPEGTLLYAGNQNVNQVVGFRVNAATGALTSLGKIVDVTGPTFVGVARMP